MILLGYVSQKKKEKRCKGSTPKVFRGVRGDNLQRRDKVPSAERAGRVLRNFCYKASGLPC